MKPVVKRMTLALALCALGAQGLAEDMPIVNDMPIVVDEPLEQDAAAEAEPSAEEDEHARVKQAQELLIELRYLAAGADGIYGPNTAIALRAFQKDFGLAADGVLNDATMQALQAKAEKKADIKTLQQRLIDLGYLTGAADGIFGDHTKKAVQLFQSINGLEASGEVDAATRAALFADGAEALPEPLNPGDCGERVEALQKRLIQFGFLGGAIDGQYGKKTSAAVKLFQEHLARQQAYAGLDITANGKATPLTLMILTDPDYSSYIGDIEAGGTGSEVQRVERRLISLGYMDKAEDKQFDDYAVETALEFQRAAGIEQGVFGQAFFDALFSEKAPEAEHFVPHLIAEGDSGLAVREVEEALVLAGMTIKMPTGGYDAKLITAITRLHDYLKAKDSPDASLFIVPERLTVEAQDWITQKLQDVATDLDATTGNAEDIRRVQRRLHMLYYLSRIGIDGRMGTKSVDALKRFQEVNGLPATGEADATTRDLLFSDGAASERIPYRVEVDISHQRVYVYELQDDGSYQQTQNFICSTGVKDATPRGIYLDGFPCNRWHYFKKFDCWAQYSFEIEGDIMFHSVLYSSQDESTLRSGSVYALGSRASHGCIRLEVKSAKWLFEHCKRGTLVILIY